MEARDIENKCVEIARRDTLEKFSISMELINSKIPELLIEIQESILEKATIFRDSLTTTVDNFDDFKKILNDKGGFISAHWDGTRETEEKIKQETKATLRCIPIYDGIDDDNEKSGRCIITAKPSDRRVLFAKAY